MNKQRIKIIEDKVREKVKKSISSKRIEYIVTDNNKMIAFKPGIEGLAEQFKYILGANEGLKAIPYSIEEVRKHFEGYELENITNELNKIAADFQM